MEHERQPIGLLFDSVGYNSPNDVDKLTDEMTIEQSFYLLTEALHYVHKTRLFTMQETELVSKSLRILHKVILDNPNQSETSE
jgi:hypothetical protein